MMASRPSFPSADLFSTPQERQAEQIALYLWLYYHSSTEEHDRRICSGASPHDPCMAIPRTAGERGSSNRNARRVMDQILYAAGQLEVSAYAFAQAQRTAEKYSTATQKELLGKINLGPELQVRINALLMPPAPTRRAYKEFSL